MSQVVVRRGAAANVSTARKLIPTWNKALPYLFLLPGLILFGLFILWPMLYSLRISFYQWNIVKPEQSVNVGLQNYIDTLADPIFQRAVGNTLFYGLVTVPGQIIL